MATVSEETVGSLLRKAELRLAACDIDAPRLDAEVLLAHAMGIDRSRLVLLLAGKSGAGPGGAEVSPAAAARYRRLVKRRALREPIAYILGLKEFWSLELEVSPAVLIPRPETEILVREALSLLPPAGSGPVNVVDVGTGSGAVAIAMAVERPDILVLAIDVSPSALEVARRNIQRHGVGSRVYPVEGDLLEEVIANPKRYPPIRMVVGNPPYIGLSERDSLMPEVRDHEPEVALFSGSDGSEAVRRLVPQAARVLPAGGWLLLEEAAGGAERTRRLLESEGHWQDLAVIDDYSGLPRVVRARRRPVVEKM